MQKADFARSKRDWQHKILLKREQWIDMSEEAMTFLDEVVDLRRQWESRMHTQSDLDLLAYLTNEKIVIMICINENYQWFKRFNKNVDTS